MRLAGRSFYIGNNGKERVVVESDGKGNGQAEQRQRRRGRENDIPYKGKVRNSLKHGKAEMIENEHERVAMAFRILQKATLAVKIIPFALTALYTICIIAYFFVSDEAQTWLDMLFFVSPSMIVSLLVLSRIFKLCKWHRTECVLPILPQCIVLLDMYVPLSEIAAQVNVAVVSTLFILSVLNAYFVFWRKPTKK